MWRKLQKMQKLFSHISHISLPCCRGWGVQWNENNGRCGICGDPWSDFPRDHEAPLGPSKPLTNIKPV